VILLWRARFSRRRPDGSACFAGLFTAIMSYFVKYSGKGSKRGKQVALPITIISLLVPIVLLGM